MFEGPFNIIININMCIYLLIVVGRHYIYNHNLIYTDNVYCMTKTVNGQTNKKVYMVIQLLKN